jgi:hypothetical protein
MTTFPWFPVFLPVQGTPIPWGRFQGTDETVDCMHYRNTGKTVKGNLSDHLTENKQEFLVIVFYLFGYLFDNKTGITYPEGPLSGGGFERFVHRSVPVVFPACS